MPWPCSWWEATGREAVRLHTQCRNDHDTTEVLGLLDEDATVEWSDTCRWPESCSTCGQVFDYLDEDCCSRSMSRSPEYRCPATGQVVLVRDLPLGALFDCGYGRERGGVSLVCVIPGQQRPQGVHTLHDVPVGVHHWHIDERASNCGSPEDNTHFCWCRHGDPHKPETVHVDKSCETCTAGAGSIAVPGFHGFLHNGAVTE